MNPSMDFVESQKAATDLSHELNYGKIIKIFTHPDTCNLHSRQVAQLRRVSRHNPSGYMLSFLPQITQLILLALEKLVEGGGDQAKVGGGVGGGGATSASSSVSSAFLPPLLSLISLASLPARRARSNEELLPAGLLAVDGLYSALGVALRSGVGAVQVQAANALCEIAKGRRGTEQKLTKGTLPAEMKVLGVAGVVKNDQRPKTKDLNQGMLNKSGVVKGCLRELEKVNRIMVAKLDSDADQGSVGYESEGNSSDEEEAGGNASVSGSAGAEGDAQAGLGESSPTTEEVGFEQNKNGNGNGNGNSDEEQQQQQHQEQQQTAANSPRRLLMALLKLLTELSESPANSALTIAEGGEQVIITTMSRLNDERDETLNMCVEILWNCLEHSSLSLELGSPSSSRTALVARRRATNAMYRLSTFPCVATLSDTFKSLLVRGFRNKDKELRNEVLILSSLVARNKRSHKFFNETGFAATMCVYATVAEVGADPTDNTNGNGNFDLGYDVDPHNFATVSPADIELKRILWNLLSDLARSDEEILDIVVESPLIETLLMYMDTDLDGDGIDDDNVYVDEGEGEGECEDEDVDEDENANEETPEGRGGLDLDLDLNMDMDMDMDMDMEMDNNVNVNANSTNKKRPLADNSSNIISRIPRTQLRVLQQQAITVLLNLAPRAPEKFRSLGGHVITLKFLDWCGQSEANRDLVQGALMLLISVVGLPGLQEELGQLDAIRIMLGRFNDVDAPESLRADAVRIISRLCAGNVENQELFRKHVGIVSLVKELEEYCKHRRVICGKAVVKKEGGEDASDSKSQEDKEDEGSLMGGSAKEKVSSLIIGVVDCIWNAVIGNKSSEARFLHVSGSDGLLDLLEICPALQRSQICGVLADLVRNPRSLPYLTAWRSDRSMMSAVQLLMLLWEEEEAKLKVGRNNGVIVDLWKPLGRHTGLADPPDRPTDFFNMAGNDPVSELMSSEVLAMEAAKTEQNSTTMAAFKKLEKALAAGQKRGEGTWRGC